MYYLHMKNYVNSNKEKIYNYSLKNITEESSLDLKMIEQVNFACELMLLMNGEFTTMFNIKIALLKINQIKNFEKELK